LDKSIIYYFLHSTQLVEDTHISFGRKCDKTET
jgi:hypothetical protein